MLTRPEFASLTPPLRGAVFMTDGYEPYNAIAEAHNLIELGCWVHARQYFVEAEDVLPKKAPHVQRLFGDSRSCASADTGTFSGGIVAEADFDATVTTLHVAVYAGLSGLPLDG